MEEVPHFAGTPAIMIRAQESMQIEKPQRLLNGLIRNKPYILLQMS
jgi:hypothetical protein